MINVLKNVIKRTIPSKYRPIYNKTFYLVFSFDLKNDVCSKFDFDYIFIDSVSDYQNLGGVIPPNVLDKFQKAFLENGKMCCVSYNKKLAHVSWFSSTYKGIMFDSIFETGIFNHKDIGYIGPCETYTEFRGKGIYPFVLKKICEYQKEYGVKEVYINTKSNNTSSIKGILKSGFKLHSKVRVIQLFGHKYIKLLNVNETK